MPIAEVPYVTFVWADHFPNGYPDDAGGVRGRGRAAEGRGHQHLTYFGSTDFDGDGAIRAVWTTISGFGGAYDDGQGNMMLNTPENIAAIEFLRKLAAQEYVPEVVFAGGFQEEEAFKDASAASIPTGMFGYRYIRPLTAPNGNEYTKETEQDMLDAIEAGDVILAPFVAPEGKKPGCGLAVSALIMPVGAKNLEAAYDYINWLMTDPEQNADWVHPGCGRHSRAQSTTFEQPEFQSNFYQQAKARGRSQRLPPLAGLADAHGTRPSRSS